MPAIENLRIGGKRSKEVTFLPDPEPTPRYYTVISVDDHLVEPPETFEGRMPSRQDRGPRVIEQEDGSQVWDGGPQDPQRGGERRRTAILSTRWSPPASTRCGAAPGTSRPESRIWTSPASGRPSVSPRWWRDSPARVSPRQKTKSSASPPCGRGTTGTSRHGPEPIPTDYPAAGDVAARPGDRRQRDLSQRGARIHSLSFPEMPEKLGLPSINTGYWDPLMRACEETGTVLSLHVGSGSWVVMGPTMRRRGADVTVLRRLYHHDLGLAVFQDPGAVPQAEDRAVRGRYRLGPGADRPDRALLPV